MNTRAVSSAVLPARYERDAQGHLVVVEPERPAPELLTEDEAVRYLRLDHIQGLKHPDRTLERYRSLGKLRATQVGRMVFYRRIELDRLLELLTDGA